VIPVEFVECRILYTYRGLAILVCSNPETLTVMSLIRAAENIIGPIENCPSTILEYLF